MGVVLTPLCIVCIVLYLRLQCLDVLAPVCWAGTQPEDPSHAACWQVSGPLLVNDHHLADHPSQPHLVFIKIIIIIIIRSTTLVFIVQILQDHIHQLVRLQLNSGQVEKWFVLKK